MDTGARRPTPTAAPQRRFVSSFSVVHVAGIDIRVHVSFFLLVLLFAAIFSGPGAPGILAGLGWLVAIFTCVVVHELAHSLVARRRGASVHEIVLLPIGGVSKLENLPETPADEFAIAIAGPAASLGLAAAAGLVAALSRAPVLPIDFIEGELVARLMWFNLIVGAFNLLPAFPLDGGRVLRSILERRYDLERATHVAARVGRVLALALAAVGVFVDLWLVLIGVFVYFGATTEETATTIHVRLHGRRLADVMLRDPVTLDPATPTSELGALPQRTAQRVFPVVGAEGYVGLVRLRSALPGLPGSSAADLADRTPALAPTALIEEDALPLIVGSPARAVAVADHGRIVGLVCAEDIEHLLADDA